MAKTETRRKARAKLSVSPLFAWYDMWVGIFWDQKKRWLYVLPLPCCGLIFKFKPLDE